MLDAQQLAEAIKAEMIIEPVTLEIPPDVAAHIRRLVGPAGTKVPLPIG